MKKYSDEWKDPRWQKKRLEKFADAGWKCERCGATDKTMHVHHPKYRFGAKPWQYELSELIALCEPCHKLAHPEHSEERVGFHQSLVKDAREFFCKDLDRDVERMKMVEFIPYGTGAEEPVVRFAVNEGIYEHCSNNGASHFPMRDGYNVRVAILCLEHGEEIDRYGRDRIVREAAEWACINLTKKNQA